MVLLREMKCNRVRPEEVDLPASNMSLVQESAAPEASEPHDLTARVPEGPRERCIPVRRRRRQPYWGLAEIQAEL